MRRRFVLASLSLLAVAALAGCGQKGPLFLPKATPPAPASAASAPAPAASAATPATPAFAVPPPATSSGM